MPWLLRDRQQRWLSIQELSVASVHKLLSAYNRRGAEAIETPGKGGRYNYYLTLEPAEKFLAKFFEKAARGQIATASEIKVAYEELVGDAVDKTTIYRWLARDKWRQIVPRPSHIKADPNPQEEFKKTFHNSCSNFGESVMLTTRDRC